MKASPQYPPFHEDRKAQKLLDRIDKKLQAKSTCANLTANTYPKGIS